MDKYENAHLIRKLSNEITKAIIHDDFKSSNEQLKRSIELLSQTIYDFTILYDDETKNDEETIKGIQAKMTIALNALKQNSSQ
ncbi:hypothetical protein LC087_02905 [Bacillus carboniphilus]|uniref:Uncharacterized protein n=1 Tax=Bacillus carboniphilus TaxID=86663 RepID=A0ABY9JWJ2_9BACI|nr:hypothetical protein [Bacillus carboniphilus]WLR43169.1 hypothetical protein LC087_02905 [Bacillus carboniphilus]